MSALMRVVAIAIVFTTLYLLAVVIVHRGLEPIRQVLRLAGHMRPRRPSIERVQLLTSA
jgi:3-deoxy-D-arabino-heptulosonate 7-phosphate (DAHP) synthase class II